MPWISKQPPARNRHTLRAQKLDRQADRLLARARRTGNPSDGVRAAELRQKADRAARKGGWT